MTEDKDKQKRHSPKVQNDDKQARLAEALRANLRRRKSQSRDRAQPAGDDDQSSS